VRTGARVMVSRVSTPPEVAKEFSDGHYYSAIPDLAEVRRREAQIFASPEEIPGVDLGLDRQTALLPDLARETATAPFGDHPSGTVRYGYDNTFFGPGDALAWYGLLRIWRPNRVIEVGSGWSSAVLLDAIDATPDWTPEEIAFVEPYPDRLHELVREQDDAVLFQSTVQDVPRELFATLEAGDVLFIDSTHVSRVGSDVNHLLLDIVPTLAPGVRVHVHDIGYPFQYPKEWVYGGRAWTEAYLLRALLTGSSTLRIVWWNGAMWRHRREETTAAMPKWAENAGGSIYLEVIA
jgi:Methyltransferase domain